MITVDQFTEEIRKTVGTPFHKGGRVIGQGLDCGGIIIVALQNLGYTTEDNTRSYGNSLSVILDLLKANNFNEKSIISLPEKGDVVVLTSKEIINHIVYFSGKESIIHSWLTTGINRVVESTMLPDWWNHIHSIWRFQDLE